MADLSSLGTPDTTSAPPAPPPGGGGLSSVGTPDLSSLGTAAAAPGQTPPAPPTPGTGPGGNSISDLIHSYIQYVKSNNPNGVMQGVKDRLAALGQTAPAGMARNLDRSVLTLARAARAIDTTIKPGPHPLDGLIAQGEDYLNKSLPKDPEKAYMVNTADDATNLIGYTWLHKLMTAIPLTQAIEEIGPIGKALKNSPNAAKALLDMVEHGVTGGTQAALQGGGPGEIIKQGLAAAGTAGIFSGPDAYIGARGDMAADVAPSVRDLGGGPFTQLANEFKGPSGEPQSSESAQAATAYAREPELQQERQGNFKSQADNFAKSGLANALEQANTAASASGVSPNIRNTTAGWRYIPPDGSTSLSADETRQALGKLKDLWLDHEGTPDQNEQIKQAYNDMQSQLARHDALAAQPGAQPAAAYQVGAQPFAPHDVDSLVNSTEDYGDAAGHLRNITNQYLAQASPELRQQYLALEQRRKTLQGDFDDAQNDPDEGPNKRDEIMRNLDDVNTRMEGLFTKTGLPDSPEAVAAPLKLLKLSNAFDMLQNTMDRHFTFLKQTAQDINRPRTATKLDSLASHIEGVKSRYGDVLNPVLGDQGLNHIIELGDLLKTGGGAGVKPAPQDFMSNLSEVFKQHFSGRAGLAKGGATAYLLHRLATVIGGGIGGEAGAAGAGLGVLGTEARFRMVRRRMATDPMFAAKMIDAARKGSVTPDFSIPIPGTGKSIPRVGVAPVVGSTILNTSDTNDQQPQPTQ